MIEFLLGLVPLLVAIVVPLAAYMLKVVGERYLNIMLDAKHQATIRRVMVNAIEYGFERAGVPVDLPDDLAGEPRAVVTREARAYMERFAREAVDHFGLGKASARVVDDLFTPVIRQVQRGARGGAAAYPPPPKMGGEPPGDMPVDLR